MEGLIVKLPLLRSLCCPMPCCVLHAACCAVQVYQRLAMLFWVLPLMLRAPRAPCPVLGQTMMRALRPVLRALPPSASTGVPAAGHAVLGAAHERRGVRGRAEGAVVEEVVLPMPEAREVSTQRGEGHGRQWLRPMSGQK